MPNINTNIVPYISPAQLFNRLANDNSVSVRWLTARDPLYFESINRPIADLAFRQLILARSIDRVNLCIALRAMFPFIITPTVDGVNLPAGWIHDMHVTIPEDFTNLRLSRLHRIDGHNAGTMCGPGTPYEDYTGHIRLVFSADWAEDPSAYVDLFTVVYEIDSDLQYQRHRIDVIVDTDGGLYNPSEEDYHSAINGQVTFSTIDQTSAEVRYFYDTIPPTDSGLTIKPIGDSTVDTVDEDPIPNGTGLLTDLAYNLDSGLAIVDYHGVPLMIDRIYRMELPDDEDQKLRMYPSTPGSAMLQVDMTGYIKGTDVYRYAPPNILAVPGAKSLIFRNATIAPVNNPSGPGLAAEITFAGGGGGGGGDPEAWKAIFYGVSIDFDGTDLTLEGNYFVGADDGSGAITGTTPLTASVPAGPGDWYYVFLEHDGANPVLNITSAVSGASKRRLIGVVKDGYRSRQEGRFFSFQDQIQVPLSGSPDGQLLMVDTQYPQTREMHWRGYSMSPYLPVALPMIGDVSGDFLFLVEGKATKESDFAIYTASGDYDGLLFSIEGHLYWEGDSSKRLFKTSDGGYADLHYAPIIPGSASIHTLPTGSVATQAVFTAPPASLNQNGTQVGSTTGPGPIEYWNRDTFLHSAVNYPYLHHDTNNQGFINYNTGEAEVNFNDDTIDPAQPTVTPVAGGLVQLSYMTVGDDAPNGLMRLRCPTGLNNPLTLTANFAQLTKDGAISLRYKSFGQYATDDEADLYLYCHGCHLIHI